MSLERWEVKLLVLVGVFIIPFVCTFLPVKVHGYMIKKGEKGKKMLSALMCFGGGVFFATYILHMAPEARTILENAFLFPNNITYPVSELLMGVGFFVVLLLEKFIIKLNKARVKHKNRKKREACMQFNKLQQFPIQIPAENQGITFCASEHDESSVCGKHGKGINDQSGQMTNGSDMGMMPNGAAINLAVSNSDNQLEKETFPHGKPSACPLLGTGECCNDPVEIRIQVDPTEDVQMVGVREASDELDAANIHNTRSLVLLVALSLHRIFEGMSVGLQKTTFNTVNLFIAIMCHETVIGFSLGLQFVKNNMSTKKIFVACFLCSLILPIGVAVGTVVTEIGKESNQLEVANGFLQSMATGTFIYVTFFEILQDEIGEHDTSILKVFSAIVGFAVMAGLSAVPEEQAMHIEANTTTTMLFLQNAPTTTIPIS